MLRPTRHEDGTAEVIAGVRAVVFDFNGTISDDEPILDRLYRELFAGLGIAMTSDDYYRDLAGYSDVEIVERALELHGIDSTPSLRTDLLRARVDRYKALVAARSPIPPAAIAFVRATAERVPVAIASGAMREEIDYVLAMAGLIETFSAIVGVDDVEHGKPDPEGYTRALARLNRAIGADPPITPAEVLVFEDADPGVQAAKAAGMRCAALAGPAYTGVPVSADITVARLDPALLDRLL